MVQYAVLANGRLSGNYTRWPNRAHLEWHRGSAGDDPGKIGDSGLDDMGTGREAPEKDLTPRLFLVAYLRVIEIDIQAVANHEGRIEQKIYKIGEPSSDSPLFITTNFSLTYFIVSGEVENSKVPSYLAVMDCEGLSVLTAWAAGKFTAGKIAEFIKESGVENNISHREIIIPGYVAILSGAIEDKLEGWKITVGPREANGIPAFLRTRTAH